MTTIGIALFFLCLGCGGDVVMSPAGPVISQVLPQTIAVGSRSVSMKVVGTNFTNEAVILWNGSKLATSMVDATTLVATVDSSNLAAPEVAQLLVQNSQTGQQSQSLPVSVVSPAAVTPTPVTPTPVTPTPVTPTPVTPTPVTPTPVTPTPVTPTPVTPTPVTPTPVTPTPVTPAPVTPPTPRVDPLTISTAALTSGTVGNSYAMNLAAMGGTPAYTWSVTSGALPPGITLSAATGAIVGTPTTSGTYSVGVQVSDAGSPAQTATGVLTLSVAAGARAQPLVISSAALPGATIARAYSGSLSATGGTGPYTWSIMSGNLPGGLNLSPSTGVIAGTPSVGGTFSFVVKVTDSGNPPQTASTAVSIVVPSAVSNLLTITSSTLASGTAGTVYAAGLQASGGTPAYTWSITSGSLPAGLTLAATTGVISGTPTASATSSFTATVSDNGNPVQTRSVAASITVAAATTQVTGPGVTWYVRPDGGTRYSAHQQQGQCDGKGDNAYPGTGTNQHCAFNDYRYLYDDQSYQNQAWVIAGGDTVIIRGGPWRVGVEQGATPNTVWCNGLGNPYGCNNPTIPAGSSTQHTRILGENHGSCNQSNMTQLFGGYGVWAALNLSGAQNVDVECLELTRHSQCVTFGVPAVPNVCNTSYPLDDYSKNGITTDTGTHDVLLQDMWIHGFTSRGIIGPIGGVVTATRVDIAYNGAAGWDLDDGNSTPMVNGVLNLNYTTVEWSGCNQAYPGTGAISCYGQSDGGYGDGIGTPSGTCITSNVDHSTFRYNTQDGFDMLHNDTGNCSMSITNSTSYGNNGQAFKWGAHDSPLVFTNNTVVANCRRMSAPMTGQPSTYNTNLHDFCRAGDGMAFNFQQGGTALVAGNTFVAYSPTILDIGCTDSAGCSSSTLTFKDNIVVAYANSAYDYGGTSGPGLFYYGGVIGNVVRSNNIYYGIGHGFSCPTGNPNESCQSPLLVNQPIYTGESSLDNFDFQLTSGSPAKGAGVSVPGLTLDYSGAVRGTPLSIGAFE